MKPSRYQFRKAGLIFLAVSAVLAIGANVSRWLHDEAGKPKKYELVREYYAHTARAMLGK